MISVRDLNKSYGKNQVLNNLNIDLHAGNVYGIVGANGAGKTTFFRCLAGLEKHKGHIRSDRGPMKERMGYLPSEMYFLPKITGREHLELLVRARKKELPDMDKWNFFGLPLDSYVSGYSTGMKKKLAIMGVLLQNNDIYILDEPYNGLDFQSSLILTDIIRRLRSEHKTVVLSSHIFGTLEETADSIMLLRNGRLDLSVSRGNFPELREQLVKELLPVSLDGVL